MRTPSSHAFSRGSEGNCNVQFSLRAARISSQKTVMRLACCAAGLAAWWLQHSAWILIPVFGVVIAYGIAIPNVLSQALRHYREQAGAAGALFGLSYYLLLGMMLGVAGTVQQLGLVLSVCALLAWICSLRRR